jgi:VWFA-related protein
MLCLKLSAYLSRIAATTLLTPFTHAQSSPTPPATTPPSSGVTLKTNARIVILDVVVTDRNQHPVHNLKQSDFAVLDNDTTQTVTHFEEHIYPKPGAPPAAPMLKLPPGIFTNYTPAPTDGPVNVLLLDALNTPMLDQTRVRDQLIKYLQQAQPGTRIAIFGLTTRLTLLQGFTSDPEVLKQVITKKLAFGSPLLDDAVGGGGIQNSLADDVEDSNVANDPNVAEVVANMREFDAQVQSFNLQLRAQYTLDAMNQIARYLAALPGRKNLIWFSGSFPITIMPDITGTLLDPFAGVASSEDEFRDTIDRLQRSQVAVYPIDARGLFTSPMFNATTTRNYTRNPSRMMQDNTKFFMNTAQEHGTMLDLAESTGGHAFVNTNGLVQAVASAIDDGSNFYTLAYTPIDTRNTGAFHKIKVQLAQQGYTLSYRRGYYADDPEKHTRPTDEGTTTAAPTPLDTMRMAMTRGAPAPTEILLKVGVVPLNPITQPEDKPATRNNPAPSLRGPYRRYSVNYVVDPAGITFLRSPDGKVRADFSFTIYVYDVEGKPLNAIDNNMHVNAPLEDIKKAVAQGIFFHQEISAPIKGEYFLRIAVHDLNRDHYGAVEVATSSVRNVVPLTPPPAPAASTPQTGSNK